jgi:hypothetical protein
MKTGWPEYRLPSPQTVSRDVKHVFARVHKQIAKMLRVSILPWLLHIFWDSLQEHNGAISFATDAWTSPNSRGFVAITTHFEHKGDPVSLLLDIVEVGWSHSGLNLLLGNDRWQVPRTHTKATLFPLTIATAPRRRNRQGKKRDWAYPNLKPSSHRLGSSKLASNTHNKQNLEANHLTCFDAPPRRRVGSQVLVI